MDPVTVTLTTIGLALGVAGTLALVAWRHGRLRARVPLAALAAAVALLAAPPLVEQATTAIDPAPHGAADAPHHPDDAVVHPDELERR